MLLLVNPPIGTWGEEYYIPYGLMLIKGVVRDAGICNPEILDLELLTKKRTIDIFSEDFYEKAADLILKRFPRIVGFSTIVSNFHIALNLCRRIKAVRPEIKTILGGPHASALAEETLNEFPQYVDVVVVGEGEKTIIKLLKSEFNVERMEKVEGIVFNNGTVVKTPPVVLIEYLDKLPETEIDLLKEYKELCQTGNYRPLMPEVEAGRGCVFSCSFCATAPFWQRKDRRRSPEKIYSEMLRLSAVSTTFSLTHDNFTSDKKYLRRFCEYLIEKGSEFIWVASSRGDVFTREDLAIMKRSGCRGLFIGMESGSARVQKIYNKNLDLKKCLQTFRWCEELDIGINSTFILGHPEETLDDANDSIRYAVNMAQVKNANIYITGLCPLAGSRDYDNYFYLIRPSASTADFCRRPFRHKETEDMIARHPHIFGNFGVFPCRYMSDIELTVMLEFYMVMLSKYPRLVKILLDDNNLKSVSLFERWLEWYTGKYKDRIISQDVIELTFHIFLKDVFC